VNNKKDREWEAEHFLTPEQEKLVAKKVAGLQSEYDKLYSGVGSEPMGFEMKKLNVDTYIKNIAMMMAGTAQKMGMTLDQFAESIDYAIKMLHPEGVSSVDSFPIELYGQKVLQPQRYPGPVSSSCMINYYGLAILPSFIYVKKYMEGGLTGLIYSGVPLIDVKMDGKSVHATKFKEDAELRLAHIPQPRLMVLCPYCGKIMRRLGADADGHYDDHKMHCGNCAVVFDFIYYDHG